MSDGHLNLELTFQFSSIGRMDIWMSNGHFCSVCPLDEWTFECQKEISVDPMDEWAFECPMDISVRPMDEGTFIYVQWTCNVYDAMEAVRT